MSKNIKSRITEERKSTQPSPQQRSSEKSKNNFCLFNGSLGKNSNESTLTTSTFVSVTPDLSKKSVTNTSVENSDSSFSLSMKSDHFDTKSFSVDFAQVPLRKAYNVISQLLRSIIVLLKSNLPFINEKFIIQKDKVEQMEITYLAIEQEKNKFNNYVITCETDEDKQVVKEAFWLNCLNFLILSRVVELMITKPSILRNLQSQILIKSFLESTEFKISGCALNGITIFQLLVGPQLFKELSA